METINKNMGRRELFIPAHLTDEVILRAVAPRNTSKVLKNIKILLHYIVTRNIFLNSKDNVGNHGYVQVSKKARRSILGRYYNELTRMLIDAGIIEVSTLEIAHKETGDMVTVEAFGKGHSCKKYCIVDYSSYRRIDVTEDEYIVNKLNKLRGFRIQEHEVFEVLQKNTDLLKLRDNQEIRDHFTNYFASKGIRITGEEYVPLFNSLEMPMIVDTFGNRFHGKHTRLKKSFRSYLEFSGYEGSPLVNVDIVNSQPLLLSIITPEIVQSLAQECAEAVSILQKYHHRKDYIKFHRTCLRGQIYEYIIKGFKKLFDIDINRNEAKSVFYYACYSKYPDNMNKVSACVIRWRLDNLGLYDDGKINDKRLQYYSLFFLLKYFPSLYNFNLEVKRLDWQHLTTYDVERYKDYANTPLLAQRIEANLLLKHCALSIHKAGVLFTTIHDSFLVQQKDAAKVKKIIKYTFSKFNLPKPRVKVEELKESTPSHFTIAA